MGADNGRVPQLAGEAASVRAGGWQTSVGRELRGQDLGILGLGSIGSQIARIGAVFGMEVLAWSQHLTPEKAEVAGAIWVPKEALFTESDTLTIHLRLSDRTRSLVGADELARMKPTSWLVNTSRGPIVEEAALIDALSIIPSAVPPSTCSIPNPCRPTPAAHPAERVGHTPYRLRRGEPLPHVLPGRRGRHRRVVGRAMTRWNRRSSRS